MKTLQLSETTSEEQVTEITMFEDFENFLDDLENRKNPDLDQSSDFSKIP